MKPTIFAITVLTFIAALSTMSGPLIVGGPDFQTINPMIKTFANMTGSRDIAALLAIILGLATTVLLAIMQHIEKKGNFISVSKTKARMEKQKIENPVLNVLAHITAYVMLVIYMLPILNVLVFSFTDGLTIKTGQIRKDYDGKLCQAVSVSGCIQTISRERGVFPSGGTGCCGNLHCGGSYCDKGKEKI